MAGRNYEECLKRLLAHEGGYCNDVADPGGPTKFGITITDYRKYVMPVATANDVRIMSVDAAKRIYRSKYWDAQQCDRLPSGVDYSVFDYGVNSGIGRSGKVLRRVLGLKDDDWHTTDAVLNALAKRDAKAVASAINEERLRFLQSLRTWKIFGKGWARRVAEVKAFSLQLAAQATAPAPITATPMPQAVAAGKGMHYPPPSVGAITAGGGGAAAVVSGGLTHWIGAHPLKSVALAVFAIIVAFAFAGWLRARHTQKQEAPTPGIVPVPELKT